MNRVALAGNPNVGKSTLFNALTGLRQHTGNWAGKTVATARGEYSCGGREYQLIDLPGTYSLAAHSQEEAVARDYIESGQADGVVVVCDATCLERNLILVLQVLELTGKVLVCVNLMDEAKRLGIEVDLPALSRRLGVPVVGTAGARQDGLDDLKEAIARLVGEDAPAAQPERPPGERVTLAERYAAQVVRSQAADRLRRQRRLDRLLTSKATGIPLMLLLLGAVVWLTVAGANLPSALLTELFARLGAVLEGWLSAAPEWLRGLLLDGVYRVTAWVVAVMLPPMAIFFPLFTLLEDAGYLPRVAFNLDHFFQKSGAHGRQSLTMCMALGCNACGVMGCRIIQSPRERLIAILTNAFMPCNGRLPTLIALISMFFVTGDGLWSSAAAAGLLMGVIVLAVAMTLWASRFLSATVLKGEASSFSLELPPYRMPQVGQVLVRSILDRTLFVLGRAVAVAAPAGIVIWAAANLSVGGESILAHLAAILQPLGGLMGLDGFILLAFLLGFPANEIVVPCILMGYLSTGALTDYGSLAELHGLLAANGWTTVTAVCALLFTLFHFPCGATCLTVWRETGSKKWTALAAALPTAVGIALCMAVHFISVLL